LEPEDLVPKEQLEQMVLALQLVLLLHLLAEEAEAILIQEILVDQVEVVVHRVIVLFTLEV
jgi:hypothetical protein